MSEELRKLYETVTDKGLTGIMNDIEYFIDNDINAEDGLWSIRGSVSALEMCRKEILKAIDESKIDIEKMQAEYIARQGHGK